MEAYNHLGLLPADRLVIPKSFFNLVQHHGIYVGFNKSRRELVLENHPQFGVRLISLEEFLLQVTNITSIRRFVGTDVARKAAVRKGLTFLNAKYDLQNFNCEHFANLIQSGRSESLQIQNFWKLTVGIGILGLIFKK